MAIKQCAEADGLGTPVDEYLQGETALDDLGSKGQKEVKKCFEKAKAPVPSGPPGPMTGNGFNYGNRMPPPPPYNYGGGVFGGMGPGGYGQAWPGQGPYGQPGYGYGPSPWAGPSYGQGPGWNPYRSPYAMPMPYYG